MSDDFATLGDLDFLTLAQESFYFWEFVAQVANCYCGHVMHSSITTSAEIRGQVGEIFIAFSSPFRRFLSYADLATLEVAYGHSEGTDR